MYNNILMLTTECEYQMFSFHNSVCHLQTNKKTLNGINAKKDFKLFFCTVHIQTYINAY